MSGSILFSILVKGVSWLFSVSQGTVKEAYDNQTRHTHYSSRIDILILRLLYWQAMINFWLDMYVWTSFVSSTAQRL